MCTTHTLCVHVTTTYSWDNKVEKSYIQHFQVILCSAQGVLSMHKDLIRPTAFLVYFMDVQNKEGKLPSSTTYILWEEKKILNVYFMVPSCELMSQAQYMYQH